MATTGAERDAPVGWIEQCNLLNKLLGEGYDMTIKIVGLPPTTDEDTGIKAQEQCLATTLGCTLDGAVSKARGLNAQLNRMADKF